MLGESIIDGFNNSSKTSSNHNETSALTTLIEASITFSPTTASTNTPSRIPSCQPTNRTTATPSAKATAAFTNVVTAHASPLIPQPKSMATAVKSDKTTCPDQSECYNGSKCAVIESVEASGYYCDCTDATEAPYTGYHCLYNSAHFCVWNSSASDVSEWHCTNGGKCTKRIIEKDDPLWEIKESVQNHEDHFECSCPENYRGDHCEFVPDKYVEIIIGSPYASIQPSLDLDDSSESSYIGIITGALIGCGILLAVIITIVNGLRGQGRSMHFGDVFMMTDIHSERDLTLDPNGSAFYDCDSSLTSSENLSYCGVGLKKDRIISETVAVGGGRKKGKAGDISASEIALDPDGSALFKNNKIKRNPIVNDVSSGGVTSGPKEENTDSIDDNGDDTNETPIMDWKRFVGV